MVLVNNTSWRFLGLFFLLISCQSGNQNFNEDDSAANWAMLDFVKTDSINPVLQPGANSFLDPMTNKAVAWESKNVFNPAIVVRRDTVFMLYRAQDSIGKPGGTSRIGLAYSTDGLHFSKTPKPVFYPEPDAYQAYEWQGGVEDPRIVEDSTGMYFMTYTSYDGKTARLMVASSPDLQHWTKHGPVFAHAYGGKYLNQWSKSGSIVSRYAQGKIIASKINGRFWMYWGDQNIWAATSTDLIHWEPFEMQVDESAPIALKGQALKMPQLRIIIPTRDKKFDSDLVEPGPPAMLTDKGILLIYNSRNLKNIGDTSLADGTYTAGQVLINKNNPLQVLHRMNHYFIKPERSYELVGEVNNVCFLEGLAQFKHQWFLYYGTADSKIAVAVRKASYP